MYIADRIASIALAVGKDNLNLWMVQQEANQFAACIAGCTKDSNFNAFHRDEPDNMHGVL